MNGADAGYPPTPMGTKSKTSRSISPLGALLHQYAMDVDTPSTPRASASYHERSPTDVVIITSPPDFSRQYKRAGDKARDRDSKSSDITMESWSEVDAEGEVDYELETCSPTPRGRAKINMNDDLEDHLWLTRKTVRPFAHRDIDEFVESFKSVEDRQVYEYEEEPPLDMPPTPRAAHATLPKMGTYGGKHFPAPGMAETTTSLDDMPAFLTPFRERQTHPYSRSADFVLAETRKREASIKRPPPGTIRPRKKRAQREITNLCVFTLQRNFSKALQDALDAPMPSRKLRVPPDIADDPPVEMPWWGKQSSPPKGHQQLEDSSNDERLEDSEAENEDEDDTEDDDDDELKDRGLWAAQSYGVGLGLGLGFDLKAPPTSVSSGSISRVGFNVDPDSPRPPLVRTPSDKAVSRTKITTGFDTLSPALDLADGLPGMSLTPSPTSPDIVTPEFEQETGKRTVLVKENYKENPGLGMGMFNGSWNRAIPSREEDDNDDDRPLWPRPTKKDKGKGRAIPDAVEEPPISTSPEKPDDVPTIVIPAHMPIDPSQSDELNYEALAEAFGVDADELAMQYMLEMSKLDTGKTAQKVECGDSPGASGSGLPPCHSWMDDVDMDETVSDYHPSSPVSTNKAYHSSSAGSCSSRVDNKSHGPALNGSFSTWCKTFMGKAVDNTPPRPSSSSSRSRMQLGNEVGPNRIGLKRKAI